MTTLATRVAVDHPRTYLAMEEVGYRLRALLHLVTWVCLDVTIAGAGWFYLLDDTPFQRWVAHVTPTNGVGEHDTLATVVSDPQLLFIVMVASVMSAMLISAGGLRRARRGGSGC